MNGSAMIKAYSYIRMSTESQLKGDSLRRQTDQTAKYVLEHGLELDETLHLEDIGLSAYDGANISKGALGRFLEAIRLGRIERGSYLIVESLDRLSRQQPRVALSQFLNILNADITVVALAEGKEFRPEHVDATDLILTIGSMTRAYDESAIKSVRVREAWEQKKLGAASQKLTRQCPRWLWLDVESGKFEVIPDRVKTVRRIFDLALNGLGADAITRHLNRERTPAFGKGCTTKRTQKDIGSTSWQKSSVLKILRFRAVLGEYQPHQIVGGKRRPVGPPSTGYYPQVVSDETFYSVQLAIEGRRLAGGGRKGVFVSNLFTKIAKCGYCGSAMHLINRGGKGGRSLVCDNAKRGLGCWLISWKYDEFEESCLTFISELDLGSLSPEPAEMDADGKIENTLRELDGRLVDAARERDRAYELFTGPDPSPYIRSKFVEVETLIGELERRRRELAQELSRLQQSKRAYQQSRESIQAVVERMRNRSDAEITVLRASAAARIADIVREIVVFPGGSRLSAKDELEVENRLRELGKGDWQIDVNAIDDPPRNNPSESDGWDVSSEAERERRPLTKHVHIKARDPELIEAYLEESRTRKRERPEECRGFFVWFKDGSSRFVGPAPNDPRGHSRRWEPDREAPALVEDDDEEEWKWDG